MSLTGLENFTPVSSLIGGILIGVSASALWFLTGKIAGITGIVGGLLQAAREDVLWRVLFLAGLLAGGFAMHRIDPAAFHLGVDRSPAALAIAGLLVGFGARLGNGCTSGHGVCGISRGSKRSFVATATFMATGALTVYLLDRFVGGAL